MNVSKPVSVLLIEDNPGDIDLTLEAFENSTIKCNVTVFKDGLAAREYLYKEKNYSQSETPDIILLDLNLPGKNGHELLNDIKSNEEIKKIPVVILTSSSAERDIIKSYNLQANCYIIKPVTFDKFLEVVRSIENFWFSTAKLPSQ
ncbi:MAG: response regulator [Candidatus Wallbacteria bacterium]